MLLEILCQKKSLQKHWTIYAICVVWCFMCMGNEDIINMKPYIIYGVPLFVCSLNTIVVSVVIIRIKQLLKIGKRVKCKIIHSMSDFKNGVLRIRCETKRDYSDITYQFEEKVMVPFAARSPEIDSIYKNVGSYLDMEYIDVLVNPVDYSQYEILYFELLSDESRKSKYSLMVMGVVFLVFIILLTKCIY